MREIISCWFLCPDASVVSAEQLLSDDTDRNPPVTDCKLNSLLTLFFFLVPEPPSLSIHPSPLPLAVPGQVLSVQCEASGFAPLSLELSWEFKGADGETRPLGSGSVTGHRQAWDGTFSQSTRLELDTSKMDLGRGGELSCVAVHAGGTRRASVTVNVIGTTERTLNEKQSLLL